MSLQGSYLWLKWARCTTNWFGLWKTHRRKGRVNNWTHWLLVYTARIIQGCYARTLNIVMASVCFYWKPACRGLWTPKQVPWLLPPARDKHCAAELWAFLLGLCSESVICVISSHRRLAMRLNWQKPWGVLSPLLASSAWEQLPLHLFNQISLLKLK